jgi:hypothetical protein
MAFKYNHCWETYYKACRILVGRGTIQERAKDAIIEIFINSSQDIHPDIRNNWQTLRDAVSAAPPSSSLGQVDTYVQGLTEDEIAEITKQIFDDFHKVEQARHSY